MFGGFFRLEFRLGFGEFFFEFGNFGIGLGCFRVLDTSSTAGRSIGGGGAIPDGKRGSFGRPASGGGIYASYF